MGKGGIFMSNGNPFIRTNFKKKTLQKLPQVLTLYLHYHLSIQEITKAVKMSPMTVSNLIEFYGRGLQTPENKYQERGGSLEKDIKIMHFEQLMSIQQIAKKLGVELNFVKNYLKKDSKFPDS
jgi:transposase